uniref:RlpA-like protein double-psi beta-barrel domain-containing protein n=1 Tax=Mycena chlorophos TaxID=658473 RepID=A0ABQ0LQ80_MYCCL|nr:predicted protein [Mycena chlorophos]
MPTEGWSSAIVTPLLLVLNLQELRFTAVVGDPPPSLYSTTRSLSQRLVYPQCFRWSSSLLQSLRALPTPSPTFVVTTSNWPNYETYHLRYLAIDCEAHHNGTSEDSFFNACCHPMLATETLAKNRPAYCAPGFKASSTSSASGPEETDSDSDDGDCESEGDDEDDSTTVVATSTHSPTHTTATEPKITSTTEKKVATTSTTEKPTTTTTHTTPKETTTSSTADKSTSTSSSSSFITGGFGTWYTQGGVAGACGTVHSDSALIVALPTKAYANGANCGRTVEIVANGVTVQATVADECPTCTNNECLDMSEALFQKFAALSIGEIDIEYKYLN